ncbi:hypothetical protein JHK82_031546 [Glycine max]|nr:hypothetical protein JHK86_031634 [Glycine max]KAG5124809.1 hypothetical protein JHK82_031546 [Glycine max]
MGSLAQPVHVFPSYPKLFCHLVLYYHFRHEYLQTTTKVLLECYTMPWCPQSRSLSQSSPTRESEEVIQLTYWKKRRKFRRTPSTHEQVAQEVQEANRGAGRQGGEEEEGRKKTTV